MTAGAAGGGAMVGQALGGGIYLQGTASVLTFNSNGTTETIAASIIDDKGAATATGYGGAAGYTEGSTSIVITSEAACYCTGTMILTDRGEVAVERLAEGDRVLTADGAARPIRWIGHRTLDLSRHPTPERVRPIRIRAHAVADGMPSRDLHVSPDHALLFDGMLILARQLVNGASITRDDQCLNVTYYHVELETHDILLAQGLPAESYLDTGNRDLFENALVPLVLHPGFDDGQQGRLARSCRPLADDGAAVEPIWRRLAVRAMLLGFLLPEAAETTRDPALRVVIGGWAIKPISVDGNRHCFVLPRAEGPARLVSCAVRPCLSRPWVEDRHRLGVAVSRLALRYGQHVEPVPLDHPLMSRGWWNVERDHASVWRWTDGDAVIPLPDARPAVLKVTLSDGLDYPVGLATTADMARTRGRAPALSGATEFRHHLVG